MIDNFSILLSHGWLILAFWFLLQRADLNSEAPPVPDAEPQGFSKRAQTKTARPENPFRKQRGGKAAVKPPAKPASGQDSADA